MINGEEMTVVWHVDDIKVSQKYTFEVTKFAQYLSTIKKKIKMLNVKIDEYL